MFGEDELIIHRHIKDTSAAGDEPRLDANFLSDLSRQTGGSGEVISNGAVFDADVHIRLLRSSEITGQSQIG